MTIYCDQMKRQFKQCFARQSRICSFIQSEDTLQTPAFVSPTQQRMRKVAVKANWTPKSAFLVDVCNASWLLDCAQAQTHKHPQEKGPT